MCLSFCSFFSLAAINLAKLKLFRHYYVLVSKKKKQKNLESVNKISSRSRTNELPKNWQKHEMCYQGRADFVLSNQIVSFDRRN